MAELERDAELTVHLEAADSRPVPGARVDHHERAHRGIGRRVALGRLDAHQGVVRRLLEASPVEDDLVVEHEHRRAAELIVLEVLVAALAQDVERQDGALPSIDPIGKYAGRFWFHGSPRG
jgi:hypothetical protein